jgi:hypothetical protein
LPLRLEMQNLVLLGETDLGSAGEQPLKG